MDKFTIISGVTTFVLGQFVLKLILDPVVGLKEVLGELSALFLREQAKLTNANSTEEVRAEIKRLTSTLLSKKQSIPFYYYFSFLLGLPKEDKLINSCTDLIGISNQIVQGSYNNSISSSIEITKAMQRISTNLKIVVFYRD